MATVNELDELVKSTEREILDLKTSHGVKSDIITFQAQYTISGAILYSPHIFRVTYEDGNQPILSFVSNVPAIMGSDGQNTQLIVIPAVFVDTTMTIVSTRPIQSIVLIS